MKDHLVIHGNAFYAIDEECMRERKKQQMEKERQDEKQQKKDRRDHQKGAS